MRLAGLSHGVRARAHRWGAPPWTWTAAGVALVCGLGALEVFWRLGASSLFVDESSSWYAAHAPVGELLHRVRALEVAPPTYYLLLHLWMSVFGDSELAMRVPSALAAVLSIAAVFWVGERVGGRLVGLLAALLAAVSPLVIEYGQEVRAYVWAMLLATIAVGAVLEADARPARAARWLALGAGAAIGAVWLHYSAIVVVAPLLVANSLRATLPRRYRIRFAIAVGSGGALVLPFLLAQLQTGNQNSIGRFAGLTLTNLKRVVGAPFDRTYPVLGVTQMTIAALVVLGAVGLLVLPHATARLRRPRLIALLAAGGPVLLLVATLAGQRVLISRYDAVSVPFMAVAIAAAAVLLVPVGLVVCLLALSTAVPASRSAHQPQHFYPDTRAAMRFVAAGWRPGEVLVSGTGYAALGAALQYYGAHLLPRDAVGVGFGLLPDVLRTGTVGRVALVTEPLGTPAQVRAAFRRYGWTVTATELSASSVALEAVVATRNAATP